MYVDTGILIFSSKQNKSAPKSRERNWLQNKTLSCVKLSNYPFEKKLHLSLYSLFCSLYLVLMKCGIIVAFIFWKFTELYIIDSAVKDKMSSGMEELELSRDAFCLTVHNLFYTSISVTLCSIRVVLCTSNHLPATHQLLKHSFLISLAEAWTQDKTAITVMSDPVSLRVHPSRRWAS